MIKLFECFSGIGSQALALKKYGVEFEHVGIAEIDKYAIAAHESLHGEVKNYGDVSKLEVSELPNMDLLTYSFPCQDISNAGKQKGLEKGSGTRSSLLWECERIIEAKRPKFLMMENVKNLVGKKNKPHFDEWLQLLEGLGYNNYWKVINAKWCGVPQNRERVFCVSILKEHDNGQFKFYDDFDNGIRLKDILEEEVDEKYYLSDEKTKGFIERITTDNGLSIVGNISPNNHGGGNVYDSTGISRTLLARDFKDPVKILVKEATNQKDSLVFVNNLKMVGMLDMKGNESIRRVYNPSGLCPALTTMQGGHREPKIVERYRIRKLTPTECFGLMGLTDEEISKIQSTIVNKKPISNSQQYKLAGNSIVVDCMRFLNNLEVL